MVVKETASKSLLDTYEAERRPVALDTLRLSLQNYEKTCSIARRLGVDPHIATQLVKSVSASSLIPQSIKSMFLFFDNFYLIKLY